MKIKKRRKRFFANRLYLAKMPQTIFSLQDYMDFALQIQYYISMLLKGSMLVYLATSDWMLVSILTFIIGRTTPAGYVPALKRTRKSEKGLDNPKENRERTWKTITSWWSQEGSVYNCYLSGF